MTQHVSSEVALFEALEARSRNGAAGDVADLTDIEQLDRLGPAAFQAVAQRFGWKRQDSGWLRERVPRWTPGWVEHRHFEQWMALFEAAFGYRMATDLWRWKYRRNPLPGMGAWRNGELVAFYGGMTREVRRFGGPPEPAMQIGDVMTRPDERAVITRTGPFQLAASTYMERNGGHDLPSLLGYGFPTDKALKVAQRLGLYEQIDQMMEVAWEPDPTSESWLTQSVPVTQAHRGVVDRLWSSMKEHFKTSLVGERDWSYLTDRYGTHPVNHYELLLVRHRITHRAKGVIALRDRGEGGGVEVMDLMGDPDDWPELVRTIRRWTARKGRHRAYLWVTESHVRLLESTQPRVAPLEALVPANIWTPAATVDELKGRWWLTGGDTDFR
ncbi:MAG: GNAT family N-acetyltransferase [Ramlibacter sp.]|nr:GNAT family N-acetyltransferase [Ramlibacter sp.]